MKTLFLTIACVFTLYTLHAQQNNMAFLETQNDHFSIKNTYNFDRISNTSKHVNSDYLKKVYLKETSDEVKKLEHDVCNYNIKKHAIYDDSEKATYQVVFKRKYAKIIATYNNSGKLLGSKETFKNVKIPYQLRILLAKEYPEWSFRNNTYSVVYSIHKQPKRCFQVTIQKGKQKKTLTFKNIHS